MSLLLKFLLLFLFQFVFFIQLRASSSEDSIIKIHNLHFGKIDLNNSSTAILLDSSAKLSLTDILKKGNRSRFVPYSSTLAPIPFSENYRIWRKLKLVSDEDLSMFLVPGTADYINLYVVEGKKVTKIIAGSMVPVQFLSDTRFYRAFQVNLQAKKVHELYIEFYNKYPISIVASISIYDVEKFWSSKDYYRDFRYFFIGGVLIMIMYHFILFISSRDVTYLLYVMYMVVIFLSVILDYQFYSAVFPIFSHYPEQALFINILTGQAIGIFYILFFRKLTNLRQHNKDFDQWNKIWFAIRAISLPVIIYLYFNKSPENVTQIGHLSDILMGIANLIVAFNSKKKIAKYFIWGAGLLVIGASLTVSEEFDIMILGDKSYGMPIQLSILGELTMFSVGLGIRVRITEVEKREAERHLLDQLLQNEKLQTTVNRELEKKVTERTTEIEKRTREILKQNVILVGQKEELQVQAAAIQKANEVVKEKNEELYISLEKLKIAQAELVQSEKMASLGLLTAGIAHEINNPINFVSSNVRPIKKDFLEIKELFSRYRQLFTSNNVQEDLKTIYNYEKEIEAEYIFEEIEMLLNGIEEGAVRTREIVMGLKNFSRSEGIEYKEVNIHSGLDSTLMLLQSKIKNRIEIVKNYDTSIPLIECFPGKLNQVFMNILTNSIQAIQVPGKIIISTKLCNDTIEISIKDNGIGIKKEVKDKIFQPFFTTKEIGKGTGLGLSISFGIIEDHHGRIEVRSEEGEGAEFVIVLPMKPSRYYSINP